MNLWKFLICLVIGFLIKCIKFAEYNYDIRNEQEIHSTIVGTIRDQNFCGDHKNQTKLNLKEKKSMDYFVHFVYITSNFFSSYHLNNSDISFELDNE